MYQGNAALRLEEDWEKPEVSPDASYGRVLYNYYRTYDPPTGRYLTADPVGLDGGINPYLYANANPLRFSDPLGLIPCTCEATGGGSRESGQKVCTYICTCTCDSGKKKTSSVKAIAGSSDNAVCLGQVGPEPAFPVPRFDSFNFNTDGVSGFFNRYLNPFGPTGDMMDELERGCDGCPK